MERSKRESVEETNCIPHQKGAQGSYVHVWFHLGGERGCSDFFNAQPNYLIY